MPSCPRQARVAPSPCCCQRRRLCSGRTWLPSASSRIHIFSWPRVHDQTCRVQGTVFLCCAQFAAPREPHADRASHRSIAVVFAGWSAKRPTDTAHGVLRQAQLEPVVHHPKHQTSADQCRDQLFLPSACTPHGQPQRVDHASLGLRTSRRFGPMRSHAVAPYVLRQSAGRWYLHQG